MEKKRHILLIEDDKNDMLFFAEAYKQTQIPSKCTWAQSGEQALSQLAYITPDIVFLDLEMPGMDGFQCLELIRSVPRLHDIPVVVYANALTSSTRERAMTLGATACMEKLHVPDELVQKLRPFLGAAANLVKNPE